MKIAWDRRTSYFLQRSLLAVVSLTLLALSFPSQSRAQSALSEHQVTTELARMGPQGHEIANARDLVLSILQGENSCSQWFDEVNPQSAEVFRSLHFEVEANGAFYVYEMSGAKGDFLFKQPWSASTSEGTGRNSLIRLNANGAFFSQASRVIRTATGEDIMRLGGMHPLSIVSFAGSTSKAQMVILLHELGHIVGRLPADDDSWDGRSTQNSLETLRHCKQEIRSAAHKYIAQR